MGSDRVECLSGSFIPLVFLTRDVLWADGCLVPVPLFLHFLLSFTAVFVASGYTESFLHVQAKYKKVLLLQSRNGTPYNKIGRWCIFVLLYLLPYVFKLVYIFYYFYDSGFTDVGNRISKLYPKING